MRKNNGSRLEDRRRNNQRSLRLETLEERRLLDAVSLIDGVLSNDDSFACPYAITSDDLQTSSIEATVLESVDDEAACLSNTMDDLFVAAGEDPTALTEDFIFNLNSCPDSSITIYLDFTGHTTSGVDWNREIVYGEDIETPAYDDDGDPTTFSNQELRNIYEIWLVVSEDYMPFNVNVTTAEPTIDQLTKTDDADDSYGVRVCIGGSYADWYGSKCIGVSMVGNFTSSEDSPVYIFSEYVGASVRNLADAASHEVGHSLNLSHDGDYSSEYYFGNRSWGPIMGGVGSAKLVQWSQGEYADANNHEDDLAILTTYGGFGYRADDHGDTFETATSLDFAVGTTIGSGIVEQNTDVDFFSFELNGEEAVIRVGGIDTVTNLDPIVSVYDSSYNLVATYDPTCTIYGTNTTPILYTSFDVSDYEPGLYYMSVAGTGLTVNNKLVYSDYGSLGAYTIEVQTPPPTENPYSENTTVSSAYDLGVITEPTSFTSLTTRRYMPAYLKFTLAEGYSGVSIRFEYGYQWQDTEMKANFNSGSRWEGYFQAGTRYYQDLEEGSVYYLMFYSTLWNHPTPYSFTIVPLEETLEIGDVEVSAYDSATDQAELEWESILGAESYTLSISEDDGESWNEYASNLTELSLTVDNLVPGNVYDFRVTALDLDGEEIANYDVGTFAPIALSSQTSTYLAGETLSVELTSAQNAGVDVRWFYVTDEGDVEIDEARGSLTYVPTDRDHNIKVVATGIGISRGSNAELVFTHEPTVSLVKDADSTHGYTVLWDAVEDAVAYKLKTSTDGGETWASTPAMTDLSVERNFYSGYNYTVAVWSFSADGRAKLAYTTTLNLKPAIVSFVRTSASKATLEWSVVDNATSYAIKVLKDYADPDLEDAWVTYRTGVASTSLNMTISSSAYTFVKFRVYAQNEAGALISSSKDFDPSDSDAYAALDQYFELVVENELLEEI